MSDPLSSALSSISNMEFRRKRECVVSPASKLIGNVLEIMRKSGYIGDFKFVDDGRSGKFVVHLLGRINKCGAIRPRFPVRVDDIESWEKQFLPSKDIGILVLSTSAGVVSHKEAKEKRLGGKLLAFVY